MIYSSAHSSFLGEWYQIVLLAIKPPTTTWESMLKRKREREREIVEGREREREAFGPGACPQTPKQASKREREREGIRSLSYVISCVPSTVGRGHALKPEERKRERKRERGG